MVRSFYLGLGAPIGWGLLILSSCGGGEYPDEPPWRWRVPPEPMTVEGVAAGEQDKELLAIVCEILSEQASQGLDVKIIPKPVPMIVVGNPKGLRLRPVAFDQSGTRTEFSPGSSVSTPDVRMSMYRAALPGRSIKAIGLEELPPGGEKTLASKAAEALLQRGVSLSFPEDGRPFSLSIRDTAIKSSDFEGNPVIIHWWASW